MITASDIDRWETAIQKAHEKRCLSYPKATERGWRLLYSPRRVFAGARVAFLGFNPGGDTINPDHGVFSSERGSAYRRDIEDWGPRNRLQEQAIALFRRLGVEPEDVFASNLVPFRSPGRKALEGDKEAIAFGRDLWKDILSKFQPEIMVTMDGVANDEISKLLGVRNRTAYPTGWGNVTAARGEFAAGSTWIGLPHLSRYKIMTHDKSQLALDQIFMGLG